MHPPETTPITFIGIGQVGGGLAGGLIRLGYPVTVAARDPGSDTVKAALAHLPGLAVLAKRDAVARAEVVFLATPFQAAAVALADAGDLAGKILVDCTNPVGPGLSHGLRSERSGAEVVQAAAPGARVVKAFTIYGFENFENPVYPGYADLKPAMLIAGDDPAAKGTVGELCARLGWEPVDTGPLANSLHLEHLTLLWFKMARAQGAGPNFVWARLRR